MMDSIRITILVFSVLLAKAQNQLPDSALIKEFHQKEEKARQYTSLSMYEQSITEWENAIDWAKDNGLTREYLDASISQAELFRKIMDFDRALELLTSLNGTEKYPKIHVRKLGRLAAVHQERVAKPFEQNKTDTSAFYIQKALKLAISYGFKDEEASLKNELGYFMLHMSRPREGLPILLDAATIFYQLNDTLNYISAMTHVVDVYHRIRDTRREDSTARALTKLLERTNWYSAKVDLYNLIAHSALKRGDSSKYYRWAQKVDDALVNHYSAINTRQMADFKIFHDTKKYQDDAIASKSLALEKGQELEKQRGQTKRLILVLSGLGILILLVAGLFLRERRLKAKMDEIIQALNVANDKYHMLMVESNHRIKNNLQMVISMLRYTSKDLDSSNAKALRGISGKIETISALHKHLSFDIHNPKISIRTYFEEIFELYEKIAPEKLNVQKAIQDVEIKSERIVYFGLIFNELLSNTIEHGGEDKTVNIEVKSLEDTYMFRYQDDSVIQDNNLKGMGSQLINQLIKRVGGKNIVFDPSIGLYQFYFHA